MTGDSPINPSCGHRLPMTYSAAGCQAGTCAGERMSRALQVDVRAVIDQRDRLLVAHEEHRRTIVALEAALRGEVGRV